MNESRSSYPTEPVLHSVSIQVADMDLSLAFYRDTVGLGVLKEPFAFKERHVAWLSAGTIALEIYTVKSSLVPVAKPLGFTGLDHLAFEVPDVWEVVRHFRSHGYDPVREPFLPPTGDPMQPLVVFFAGPDDEEVQFREPYGSESIR